MHRFILRPLSPWSTPLRSDTLNGLLLYRMAEDEGEDAVRVAIAAFLRGQPPFAVSSVLPLGFVPAPRLAPIPRAVFCDLIEQGRFAGADTPKKALASMKLFRKRRWLPLPLWLKHRASLSTAALFADFCRAPDPFAVPAGHKGREPHVSIDRAAGSALEGGLYFCGATYFPRDTAFHLYAESAEPDRLLTRLERIGQLGFGRDAGTGKGRFVIERDIAFQPAPLAGEGTHRMLLSLFAAPALPDLRGSYALEVKRGKTGAAMGGNPFKTPFLCVAEGSVLTRLPPVPAVLEGLHADPRVVQVLAPLTLPCALGS